MPYRLVRAEGTDKYYVMTTDSGRLHSKQPMTKEMAKRQMTALNLAHAREKGYDVPPPLKRKSDVITMPRRKFIAEHKQLIGLLNRMGVEGERQQRELSNYVR